MHKIDVGAWNYSGGTIDIKKILPNLYDKLTIENFSCGASMYIWAQGSFSKGTGGNRSLTYDQSTGILTIQKWIVRGSDGTAEASGRIYCYYVE